MKYFIDCEFADYMKQPKLFGFINIGKPIKVIELVSITVKDPEGREWKTGYVPKNGTVPKTAIHFIAASTLPHFVNDKLEKDFMETAHNSLATLIPHVFSKFKKNEDGSYTVPALKAERWLQRANKSYLDLNDRELRVPYREAEKYMETVRNHKDSMIKH